LRLNLYFNDILYFRQK